MGTGELHGYWMGEGSWRSWGYRREVGGQQWLGSWDGEVGIMVGWAGNSAIPEYTFSPTQCMMYACIRAGSSSCAELDGVEDFKNLQQPPRRGMHVYSNGNLRVSVLTRHNPSRECTLARLANSRHAAGRDLVSQ